MNRKHLFDEISCSVPVSGSRFNIADQSIIENLHCGDDIKEVIYILNSIRGTKIYNSVTN